MDYALDSGCVLVAAAGNDGIEQPLYPAAFADVISVGALNPLGHIAQSSNRGRHIDILAPGVQIVSTSLGKAYSTSSGTSTSASIVAAAIASLRSERALSSHTIQRLVVTGQRTGDPAPTLDVHAALQARTRDFHDIAVRGVVVDENAVYSGSPIHVSAHICNVGTYAQEECDVLLHWVLIPYSLYLQVLMLSEPPVL